MHDTNYVEKIKPIITESAEKYKNMSDKGLVWELIKLEIRNFTIPYCIDKKRKETAYENELKKKVEALFRIVNSNNQIDDTTLNEFHAVKNNLDILAKNKARGIIFRSKCQWTEEGEKHTAYFLRLEKCNNVNKLISKIKINEDILTDPQDILNEERSIYNKLYSLPMKSDQNTATSDKQFFLENNSLPQLNETDKARCENAITERELIISIKAMKNCKSPGCDGLTSEFYKFFWTNIKTSLLNSINYGLETGRLSTEQRRGILSLLPKKDKDRLFLQNWRPISLLNVDYKILAKILANRIIKSLPYLVDDDQTGYIKGRFIGCNIRLVEDIIHYTSLTKTPGILLSVDFEKAFDSIRWDYILSSLKAFNFGPNFIGYIKTLYNDISTAIINNGYISTWFQPERGVRQGCPISPYLFILAVETLSSKIRETIKGILINGTEIKISQLADDTTCFIRDKYSLKHLLSLFARFKCCAGLSINVEKTVAKPLGIFQPESNSLCGLDWTTQNVTTLGVTIPANEEDHYLLNFKKRLKNM